MFVAEVWVSMLCHMMSPSKARRHSLCWVGGGRLLLMLIPNECLSAFVRLCVAVMVWISFDEQFTIDMVVAEVWVTSDDLLDVFEFEGMFVALVKGLHNVCHG